jgi:hypothetical protein
MRFCEYGCGEEALYPPRKGKPKWSCSESYQQCLVFKRKVSRLGYNHSEETKRKIGDSNRGKRRSEEAKKRLRKPKSAEHRKKLSIARTGKKMPREVRLEQSERLKGSNNPFYGKLHTEEAVERIKLKLRLNFLKNFRKNHSLFCKVEKPKIDLKKGIIEVQCKLDSCERWFTPTYIQLYERIRGIEKTGNDGSYFYCCEEHKNECTLYGFNPYYQGGSNEKFYTQAEYFEWRREVLLRQKLMLGHNECEFCGNRNIDELSIHHEKPQKLYPDLVLDPDNGIILCGFISKNKCHLKVGHKDECSTGNLAIVSCD